MDASWGQTELREETEEGPDPDDVAVPWPKKLGCPSGDKVSKLDIFGYERYKHFCLVLPS